MRTLTIPASLYEKLEHTACEFSLSLVDLLELLSQENIHVPSLRTSAEERRSTARIPSRTRVVLCLSNKKGSYSTYKAALLQDVSNKGVGIHLVATPINDNFFQLGTLFDLIFLQENNQKPLQVCCKIERVLIHDANTLLGASFEQQQTQNSSQIIRTLLLQKNSNA